MVVEFRCVFAPWAVDGGGNFARFLTRDVITSDGELPDDRHRVANMPGRQPSNLTLTITISSSLSQVCRANMW